MRRVILVSAVLAFALLIVGCGGTLATTTTTAPATTTTAAPTTTTTMPTTTTTAAPITTTTNVSALERTFMDTFSPTALQFIQFMQDMPTDMNVAYQQLIGMMKSWQGVDAPSPRTQELLTRWRAYAAHWQTIFERGMSGSVAEAEALMGALDANEPVQLGQMLGSIMFDLGMPMPDLSPPTTTTTEPPTTTTTESKAAYKAKCKSIKYTVLNKNPDAHAGEFLKFKGQVFQIMESGGVTAMLLSVTNEGYGFYDDNVWVTYPGTFDVYEDDIINVWGECTGSYDYTSVIGAELSVPAIEAKYIEKVK